MMYVNAAVTDITDSSLLTTSKESALWLGSKLH